MKAIRQNVECRMKTGINTVAGLDYGILSGSPAIADATIFVAL
jgi:hypothetical protein